MAPTVNLTGKKFGKWTVLQKKGPKLSGTNKCVYWLCRCDCGTEREVRGSCLITGESTNCRCEQIARLKNQAVSITLPVGYAARNAVKSQYKAAAKKYGREWALTDDLFNTLVSANCFYCDRPPAQTLKSRGLNGSFVYNGIDRKDNSKGYIPGNVQTCCKVCNRAKREMGEAEFLDWLYLISDRWGGE